MRALIAALLESFSLEYLVQLTWKGATGEEVGRLLLELLVNWRTKQALLLVVVVKGVAVVVVVVGLNLFPKFLAVLVKDRVCYQIFPSLDFFLSIQHKSCLVWHVRVILMIFQSKEYDCILCPS